MISAVQLRAARAIANISRADLAKRAGVSPATITRIESGKSSYHSSCDRVIAALASLGIQVVSDNTVSRGDGASLTAPRIAVPQSEEC